MSIATYSKVVGVFNERSEADRAISDLVNAGFSKHKIGVKNCDPQAKETMKDIDKGKTRETTAK